MAHVLVIAEHDGAGLQAASLCTISASFQLAKAQGGEVHVLVAGGSARQAAEAAAKIDGVAKVLLAEGDSYAHGLAEPLAALVAEIGGGYGAILSPATSFGKNLSPRIAALLDVGQLSDIIGIVSADTFIRPIYAGNAVATVQSSDCVKMVTVRATAFEPAKADGGHAVIEAVSAAVPDARSRFIDQQLSKSLRPELTAARVVVAGGRGIGSAENFKTLIEALADKLGAAVGATRAAVDAGFTANELQIGQTGKIIAPELYIAAGVSGAIQHVAGIKDSKVIVAINKDEEALIFQVADYGLVADINQALPELCAELSK
ncbi:FAD-binding protein [Telmatospirillum sp.]|uniref:electron transfer flavoprotein subunit alpha/FixB family protein n=1 Tax=Telmatospirillum sp. TaxID=2079197 RepID=UPI0028439790|nr:FAD-binding protein [Telmatospirillum sp.]MDR3438168.1 FAD-binding protein [Telmatospirillum sp.]